MASRRAAPLSSSTSPQEGASPRFEQAHGIVFDDLDVDQHRAVVQRYRELGPDGMPIRVIVKPGQADRYARVPETVEVWTHDPTAAADRFA